MVIGREIAPQGANIASEFTGHAAVAAELRVPIEEVSIIESMSSGGWMRTGTLKTVLTRDDIENICLICLGGRAADTIIGAGPSSAAASDLANANRLLWSAMIELGLHGSLQTELTMDASCWGPEKQSARQFAARELDRLMDRAVEIITARREQILELADILVKDRVITGGRAEQVLKPVGAGAGEAKSA